KWQNATVSPGGSRFPSFSSGPAPRSNRRSTCSNMTSSGQSSCSSSRSSRWGSNNATRPSSTVPSPDGRNSRKEPPVSEPFLGQISLFPYNFAPRGWALCNGQILPIAQNTALFSLLGTTYGGNGQTTFALPDLRGRLPISS